MKLKGEKTSKETLDHKHPKGRGSIFILSLPFNALATARAQEKVRAALNRALLRSGHLQQNINLRKRSHSPPSPAFAKGDYPHQPEGEAKRLR